MFRKCISSVLIIQFLYPKVTPFVSKISLPLHNQLKPAMIYASELTLFPDTPLSRDVAEGKFAEATELERMEEMQEFIRCLTVPTIFRAEHVTMPVRINGQVPEDKDAMINCLQETMDTNGEERLQMYRSSVYSL